MLKTILKIITINLLVLFNILLILEIFLRLFIPVELSPDFRQNFHVGWTFKPGLSFISKMTYIRQNKKIDTSDYILINSQGFFDKEHQSINPNNSDSVAFFGDSYTAAIQQKRENSFVGIFDNLINKNTITPTPIYNFSVDGWAIENQYAAYQYYGKKYKPATIILVIYLGNDLLESYYPTLIKKSLLKNQIIIERPYFEVNQEKIKRHDINQIHWICRNLQIYIRLRAIIISIKSKNLISETKLRHKNELDLFLNENDYNSLMEISGGIEFHLNHMMRILNGMYQEVISDQRRMGVIVIPSNSLLRNPPLKNETIDTKIYEKTLKILQSHNIPHLAILPILKTAITKRGLSHWTYEYNGHFNPEIHEELALEIQKFVLRLQGNRTGS